MTDIWDFATKPWWWPQAGTLPSSFLPGSPGLPWAELPSNGSRDQSEPSWLQSNGSPRPSRGILPYPDPVIEPQPWQSFTAPEWPQPMWGLPKDTSPPQPAPFSPSRAPTPTDDPFTRAAFRTAQSVRPEGGRREGVPTRILESYVPHVVQGLSELVTLPGRAPVPMPKGLSVNDSGEWLVDGRPVEESAEGRAWLADQQAREDWPRTMALTMLGLGRIPGAAPPGSFGVFVGQRGANRLAEGGPHPAVDPRTALTDSEAIRILEDRKRAGDPRDADMFDRSAWIRGVEGKLKKELPDTGARLVPTGTYNDLGQEFLWQHPAGDIHKVYDIPPITVGPEVTRLYGPGAVTDLQTRRIMIGSDPTVRSGLAAANRVVAHEMQHAIQAKEKFAPGADPITEVLFPEYWEALGQPFPRGPNAMQTLRDHAETIRRGVQLYERQTPEFQAARSAYNRSAGEVEARNVAERRDKKGYLQHPNITASERPWDQIIRDPDVQLRTILEAFRRGF
jgi:hypothetical protein